MSLQKLQSHMDHKLPLGGNIPTTNDSETFLVFLWCELRRSLLRMNNHTLGINGLSWLFYASLVSHFFFRWGNPDCALIQPHTCACNMCTISSFVINWQLRRTDHNGSHKPESVLSSGTSENGSMEAALSRCPFKMETTGLGVLFHNSIMGNFMAYQDRLEVNSLQLFAHPGNWKCFSIIFDIIFAVDIVDENKQTYSTW